MAKVLLRLLSSQDCHGPINVGPRDSCMISGKNNKMILHSRIGVTEFSF